MAEGKDWPQPSGGDEDAQCHRAREEQSRFPSTRSGAGYDEGPHGARDGQGCSTELGRGRDDGICPAGSHPASSAPGAANPPDQNPCWHWWLQPDFQKNIPSSFKPS